MGPIYGTIFMDMSDAAEDAEAIGLTQFIGMLEAGLEGLYGIVDARPGDKTLVDTLHPSLEALKAARDAGRAFPDALDDMKAAAEKGKDSTKELVAKYGRSARLGERSRGVLDAGATSCAIILSAMADGMNPSPGIGDSSGCPSRAPQGSPGRAFRHRDNWGMYLRRCKASACGS